MTAQIFKEMEQGFFPCLRCESSRNIGRICPGCNGHRKVKMNLESLALKQFTDQKLNDLRNLLQQTTKPTPQPQDAQDKLQSTILKKKPVPQTVQSEQATKGELC